MDRDRAASGLVEPIANNAILEVTELRTYFHTQEGVLKAVDGVTFDVLRGRILGVVGESGCGKSVTAQSILQIVPPPGKIESGKITYHRRLSHDGLGEWVEAVDLTALPPRSQMMRSIRGGEISMVFQEPMTSLDPVYTVGDQIMEAITLHQNVTRSEAREIAIDMLARVEMVRPERTVDRYPHQLSGGMRQRVMIAIALSCNPSLLIADEPTTALDVTTQAQILELMLALQQQTEMSIVYITHDLGVIAEMSDDVMVMYLGKVVERADVDSIFYEPKHPYTRALLNSIPRTGKQGGQRLKPIRGIVPDPRAIPPGCPFWPRCSEVLSGICDQSVPTMVSVGERHQVSCHLYR
jgi:oligopeptide/dipeptide ABC transporter ATP-binding protein